VPQHSRSAAKAWPETESFAAAVSAIAGFATWFGRSCLLLVVYG
jgi:hypothetical protein